MPNNIYIINTLEAKTISGTAAPPGFDPAQVSGSQWCASPIGLSPSPPAFTDGTGGALRKGFPDATIAARTACANNTALADSISPATVAVAGGTVCTITGSRFTGATGVTFAGAAGTAFSVVNDSTIRVTAPAHVAGPGLAVVVQVPSGNTTVPGGVTYA